MAKRFTATEKWDDPWFHSLDSNHKIAWLFLLDKCNHAGIWNVNKALMEFHIGFVPGVDAFDGRVVRLKDDKWFIPKFITFQYGELNPSNRAHLSVISVLKKEGAWKGLNRSLEGRKDKDKDMDKDKVKEEEKENTVGEELPPEPRTLTPVQNIVKGWKMLTGIPTEGEESKVWDKVHFARHVRSADQLLTLFGNWETAVECMEYVYDELTKKKLTCTIETVVKRSDSFRERLAGQGR